MQNTVHVIVESGAEKGKRISVPPAGARLGRSSKNDVTLEDPLLSRHHCRLFFKENEGLWVTDLGSANHTVVNGQEVMEKRLWPGDRIEIGDTVLAVLDDSGPTLAALGSGEPVVDLGLSENDDGMAGKRKMGREFLLLLLLLVGGLVLAAGIWTYVGHHSDPEPIERPPPPRLPQTIEIQYEKVEADRENIFRYLLALNSDRILSIQIDDLANERHLVDEVQLTSNRVAELIREIHPMGFFTLREEYAGYHPNILELRDIRLTLDSQTHRTVVRNRREPEVFEAVRDKLELFGRTKLGLWAEGIPTERLVEMARESLEVAQRLYAQREIQYENLYQAIQNLQQAHMDLQSVEPKPDFYADSLTLLSDCQEQLEKKYEERRFRADRAYGVRQWSTAAEELRVIMELIPDEGDPRYREARRRLLEVENRMRSQR